MNSAVPATIGTRPHPATSTDYLSGNSECRLGHLGDVSAVRARGTELVAGGKEDFWLNVAIKRSEDEIEIRNHQNIARAGGKRSRGCLRPTVEGKLVHELSWLPFKPAEFERQRITDIAIQTWQLLARFSRTGAPNKRPLLEV